MRYHVTWGTYGSWLPGDPRGFRTRRHRQHVEGDYHNPPAAGTYAGLYAHARRSLSKPPVTIDPDLLEVIGRRCLDQFAKEGAQVCGISVAGRHVHVAVECRPDGLKQMVGRVKKVSSHCAGARIPGRLWQEGCHPVAVRDGRHWQNVLAYIAGHAPKAWVWLAE